MTPRDFDPGALADVEHHADGKRWTLVFSRYVRHSPAKVWAALTDPEQLHQWAPFDPNRNLATTGPALLLMTDGETTEEFQSNVLRAVEPELLEYTWGDDLLRWELTADGTGTRLILRHTVTSPEWLPRTAAGWHLCLVVAEHLLDGKPMGRIVGRDAKNFGWEQLHDAYAARLGIDGKAWAEEVFPDA